MYTLKYDPPMDASKGAITDEHKTFVIEEKMRSLEHVFQPISCDTSLPAYLPTSSLINILASHTNILDTFSACEPICLPS